MRVTLNVTIFLEGPFISKSSSAGEFGIDSPVARNTLGQCCIPGTLVKGHVLQSWAELTEADPSFAPDPLSLGEGAEPGSLAPKRGSVWFSDFIYGGTPGDDMKFRIQIDAERQSTVRGSYQVIESVAAAGQCVKLTGTITFFAEDDEQAKLLQRYIELGLRWTTSLGAFRTAGFGRLIDLTVTRTAVPAISSINSAEGQERIGLLIRPMAPFCIARRQSNANLFESEDTIPGGVIKGAIVSQWGNILGKGPNVTVTEDFDPERPELSRHFDSIRFTFAFPAKVDQTQRPVVAPLSLVKLPGKGGYFDVALHSEAVLIDGLAPAFKIDWKDSSDVTGAFGWPDIRRELCVRTAMDRSTLRSKTNQLFAYEMIVPDGLHWIGQVDFSSIVDSAECDKAGTQLREILSGGLNGWGKTKVTAAVTTVPGSDLESFAATKNDSIDEGFYIITLQTPSLLLNISNLSERSGADELCAEYTRVWDEISGGALQLKHYYAGQSLAGGKYLWRRFQDGPTAPYRPWLLTDRGSVFILHATVGLEADAARVVAVWQKRGLTLPSFVPNDWRHCPYVPENGYGEIMLNLSVHWDKQPLPSRCQEVQS